MRGELLTRLLCRRGAIEAKTDLTGGSALHLAACNGSPSSIQLLLASRKDVSRRSKSGKTALHAAILGGHKEIVHLLLLAGADIEARAKGGEMALHTAIFTGARRNYTALVSARS